MGLKEWQEKELLDQGLVELSEYLCAQCGKAIRGVPVATLIAPIGVAATGVFMFDSLFCFWDWITPYINLNEKEKSCPTFPTSAVCPSCTSPPAPT
jgi:hypothetical protein